MGSELHTDGTVGKALALLDDVAAFGRPVRFTEILEGAAFPKATVYRLLQTLTGQGMLSYDPEHQTYTLGVRLVRLAHTAWAHSSLAPVARPLIDALSGELHETVHLAQLDGGQVLYVDKRDATRRVEMFSDAGKVGPAYCTGLGKAMMAFLAEEDLDRAVQQQSFFRYTPATLADADSLRAELQQIRMVGHALDREEHEPGIICIAVPILSGTGRVLGALSVTSTTHRRRLADMEALAPALKKTAAGIAIEADAWRFPDRQGTRAGTPESDPK